MRDAAFYALVALALLVLVFPFLWIASTSLKAPGEVFMRLAPGELPSFVPAALWLESATFEATVDGAQAGGGEAAAKAVREQVSQRLDAARAAHEIDHYSVTLADDGNGEVVVTYDRRSTSPTALTALLASCGLVATHVSAPVRWPVLANYRRVFTEHPFHRYLINSAVVASITTLICLAIGCVCAYALARLHFPYRDAILALILAVSMFPPIAVVSPLFLAFKKLHLLNTYFALIIPYTAFGLPLTVWTLTSFFRELPIELEEAARVDGCSRMRTFVEIFLPLAAPGVFTCAILVFIFAWNEFMFALLFVTRDAMRTVTVGITLYPGQYEMPWGTIFAASTLVTLPLIVVVFALQRRIISGLTAGAVKG